MSVSYIPEWVKLCLWGKSAVRCQYEGCSKALWIDDLTKAKFDEAYIEHIIADKPTEPLCHSELSEKLSSDVNTMYIEPELWCLRRVIKGAGSGGCNSPFQHAPQDATAFPWVIELTFNPMPGGRS